MIDNNEVERSQLLNSMSLIMIVYFDFHKLYKILIIHVYLELMKRFFELIISSNKTIDNNQYFLIINFIIEFHDHKLSIEKDTRMQDFIIIILPNHIIIDKIENIYF